MLTVIVYHHNSIGDCTYRRGVLTVIAYHHNSIGDCTYRRGVVTVIVHHQFCYMNTILALHTHIVPLSLPFPPSLPLSLSLPPPPSLPPQSSGGDREM